MEEYPPEMHIQDMTQVEVVIPGWHINGHGADCRDNFNLSYMEGIGRTVGEDIETTWAGTNPLASSIREMGPAARHDTLNNPVLLSPPQIPAGLKGFLGIPEDSSGFLRTTL